MTDRILIACEESQAVTLEMRAIGLQAYSCDLLPCSGGHPEWHLRCDVREVLGESWGMIIAFPPCTHLAASGAGKFREKMRDGRQQDAIQFFMLFTQVKCPRVAIENPVGIMSRDSMLFLGKPTQIVQPWYFGEEKSKRTCLWLKGLPKLVPTAIVTKGARTRYASGKACPTWYAETLNLPPEIRAKVRSKTSIGLAKAMASQLGQLLNRGKTDV